MPFASRRQQRFAFATRQPWAKRWAKETPSFAALSEHKDAGTSLSGPGGLLATPGMGRARQRRKSDDYPDQTQFAGYTMEDWDDTRPDSFFHDSRPRTIRKRFKTMTRSEAASVAAHARWDKTPRKAKPTPKGRKPAKTDAERAAARQQAQSERDTARRATQAKQRADVLRSLNIAPDGQAALEALRNGEQPDAAALARGGFVEAGLVEQARDGSYRMTPAGRALLSAADAGDRGRAGDTISGGRDRTGARREREQAAAERKPPKQASGGGGSKKKQPPAPSKVRPPTRAERRRQQRIARMLKRPHGTKRDATMPTLKAQTPEDRAMFAKMGGGGSGGGKAGGGSSAANWKKGPDGKRHPDKGQVEALQSKLDTRRERLDKNPPADRVAAHRERSDIMQRQRRLDDQKERATHAIDKLDHGLRDKRNDINARLRRVKPNTQEQKDLVHYLKDIEAAISDTKRQRREIAMAGKSFTVYKSADGAHRWLARTTTAYRDRDGEIITEKALDADAARMTATGQYGPLRYWHVGAPDPFDPVAPWGPGLDIGDCDYSIVIGRTSIESGTFKSVAIGQAFAQSAADYELSPGFFHPPDQPNAAGEFDAIRRFERSVVPVKFGRASNLFTGMTVKEHRMDEATYKARVDAYLSDMREKGVPPEIAAGQLAGMEQADKSAQTQGIAYKSAPDDTIVINGITYKAETPEPAAELPPDVVINGFTYKALPPEFLDEQKDDDGEIEYDAGEAVGEADMGMDDQALIQAIAQAVVAKIAPMFGDMKMSELKAMLGGVTTKDASRAAEIAALKAEQAALAAKLAQLTGDQPNVTLPADVEAALKGAPAAPPDPSAPQLPPDASPLQQLAARTMPQLYQTTPNGAFNGWVPPSQS